MDSLGQRAPEYAAILRFDNSIVNAQKPIRIMAESLVNEIAGASAKDTCVGGS